MGNVGDVVSSSGRPLNVWAAATLNVLLPRMDCLNDGTTKRSVLADKSDTRTSGPSNAVQSHKELYTPARRS